VLLASLWGCQEPIKIKDAYGPGMSFDGVGSSYVWLDTSDVRATDWRTANPSLHEFVQSTLESQLAQKGYHKLAEGEPDFLLHYRVVTEVRGDPWSRRGPFTQYEKGALVVDVANPETKKIIWRAAASARINDANDLEARRKRLTRAVKGIVDRFPQSTAVKPK
jgi:hypothetical protein